MPETAVTPPPAPPPAGHGSGRWTPVSLILDRLPVTSLIGFRHDDLIYNPRPRAVPGPDEHSC